MNDTWHGVCVCVCVCVCSVEYTSLHVYMCGVYMFVAARLCHSDGE